MTLRGRPADTSSLLRGTVARVTDIDVSNGHNLPLLVLFRVVLRQRNLAFPHTESDTNALATFINTTFGSGKIGQAAKNMADALNLSQEDMDIAARVQVCLVDPATL